jgi:NAD(P)-dependent dehydrogenase (short-subunit alcohol dehydrogenase family)
VTGAGGGIGSEVAVELARRGDTVVALDNGVGVGGEPLGDSRVERTAERITGLGGTVLVSKVSVTDADAVETLVDDVVGRFGSLDVVVNTAGIIRFPSVLGETDEDWTAVLDVHLGGYLALLSAALPVMERAGHGRIVGVTSGVGLARTAVQGPAYGSAKRAVAGLTNRLAPHAPPGVTINALSPIADTRMVRAGLEAAGVDPAGLDLSALPSPESIAPAAAVLADESADRLAGHVVFCAGTELTLMSPPRLLEAVSSDHADIAARLGSIVPSVLAAANTGQRTGGGSNPRVASTSMAPDAAAGQEASRRCLVVCDDDAFAREIGAAMEARGFRPVYLDSLATPPDQAGAAMAGQDPAHTLVVALAAGSAGGTVDGWRGMLADHSAVAQDIVAHRAWLQAALTVPSPPSRVVHVVRASSPGGYTVAEAVTQLARSADDTPAVTSDVFAVAVEGPGVPTGPVAALVAQVAATEDAGALTGAELVACPNWIGVRSHPSPLATVSYDGPQVPSWVPTALADASASRAQA